MQKCLVDLCLPWLGGISERFTKQITQTLPRYYFSFNIRVVFHTKPNLVSICEDVLPPHPKNSLIFSVKCKKELIKRWMLELNSMSLQKYMILLEVRWIILEIRTGLLLRNFL